MADDNKHRRDILVADGVLRYLGDEAIADLSSAVTLTPTAGARLALISITGNDARFRVNETPTASVGVIIADGEKFWCTIDPLSGVTLIQVAATAVAHVLYFN